MIKSANDHFNCGECVTCQSIVNKGKEAFDASEIRPSALLNL
jgi:hypothetical protein